MLSMLYRLGLQNTCLRKAGNDIFGRQLRSTVESAGINVEGLLTDEDVRTTLAFVETKPDGDRDFSFYRNPGADMMLREEEVRDDIIAAGKIFHFGTLSMTNEPVRSATKHAIAVAKENGALISFDPNIREPLWKDMEEAKEQTAYGLSVCDILKISDNEIQWFSGKEDYTEGIRMLQQTYQIPLILLSMGRDGSRAYYKNMIVEVPAFLQKNTIETTGAGDTFGACCLHYILQYGLMELTEQQLKDMLTFANAAASIITTRKGALRVMPSLEEIQNYFESIS